MTQISKKVADRCSNLQKSLVFIFIGNQPKQLNLVTNDAMTTDKMVKSHEHTCESLMPQLRVEGREDRDGGSLDGGRDPALLAVQNPVVTIKLRSSLDTCDIAARA